MSIESIGSFIIIIVMWTVFPVFAYLLGENRGYKKAMKDKGETDV